LCAYIRKWGRGRFYKEGLTLLLDTPTLLTQSKKVKERVKAASKYARRGKERRCGHPLG